MKCAKVIWYAKYAPHIRYLLLYKDFRKMSIYIAFSNLHLQTHNWLAYQLGRGERRELPHWVKICKSLDLGH